MAPHYATVPEGSWLGRDARLRIGLRVGDEPPLRIELCEHATLPHELRIPALLTSCPSLSFLKIALRAHDTRDGRTFNLGVSAEL